MHLKSTHSGQEKKLVLLKKKWNTTKQYSKYIECLQKQPKMFCFVHDFLCVFHKEDQNSNKDHLLWSVQIAYSV